MLEDAKAGAGGGDLTLVERVDELHTKLNTIRDLLDNADRLQESSSEEIGDASRIASQIEKTIQAADAELNVRKYF